MAEFASKGVGTAGLTTGIIGSAGWLLNGGLGNIFGGGIGNCSDNIPVNRYEAGQSARIAELETEVKLRDANIYTDSKLLDLFKYFDGEVKAINNTLCQQAVTNQATKDSFALLQERLTCECKERKCADNTIVNYVNATFYPKLVSDVTVGTETTAQTLYNPLPINSCGCGC